MRKGKIERIGKTRCEVRMRAGRKGRKVVLVDYEEEVFIITGGEGT